MKKIIVIGLLISVFIFLNIGQAAESDLYDSASQPSDDIETFQFQKQSVFTEQSPFTSPVFNSTMDAPFDLQFSFNLEVVTGALGNAGAEFDGTYYYSTRWASNLLHKVDMSGNLVEEFSIAGVTGLRDLAFDGTFMYGGAAANTIFIMDFVTKTLVGTITSPVAVRHIAYDEASNGFWVGNWADPPTLIDMSGTTLATITTGFAGQYGSAYDSYSAGGPYLWVFDQGAGAGLPQFIYQFDIATGTATGVSHDVLLELGPNAQAIAGGLWISEGIVPGFASIGGVLQGTPDVHFAYELATAGDPTDPTPPSNFTAYSDYMTPTSMLLNWTDPSLYINGSPLTNFQILILQDSVLIDSVTMGIETYSATGLTDGQPYTFHVFAKDSIDSTSSAVSTSWTAGGAGEPNPPTSLAILDPGGGQLRAVWTNPTDNVDGTPLDDFAEINLYENGSLLATYTRTSADTGRADSADFTPAAGTNQYYVTAVDNEVPPFESDASNTAFSPLGIPFFDDFPVSGVPNPGFWLNQDAEVTDINVNPPSPPYSLTLDGFPHAAPRVGDIVDLLPVDLTGFVGTNIILSFWYQPQGTGNAPESGDSLIVDFYNDLGQWVNVRRWPGTAVQPFVNEIIAIGSINAGTGATFFHNAFQIRFRNKATVSTSTPFDHWLIDNVFLGLPNNPPIMTVTPTTIADTLLVGAMSTKTFNVSNDQSLPSVLDVVITENPAVDWLSASPDTFTLTSTQNLDVDVIFDASTVTAGTYNTQLIVTDTSGVNSPATINITMIADDAPVISISPDTFDVTLASGQTTTDTLTISNLGAGPLDWEISAGGVRPELMWYKFDEVGASQTQNYAATGTPVPLSANLMGAMSMGGTGQTGAALIGTGGSSGTDYVDTGWPTNLGADSWTIQLWLNNVDNSSTLFYHFGDNTATSFRCFSGGVAGAGNLLLRGPVADVLVSGVAPGPAVVDFVYDATVPEVRAYLNGVLNNTVAQSGVTVVGTAPFKVGGYSTSSGIAAGELLDDFKLFNRAVDPGTEYARQEWITFDTTSGILQPGESYDVVLTFDPTGLLGGDYSQQIVVSSNDPVNPEVSAGAHMLVIGTPLIATTPDTVVMDTTFTGGTDTKTFWVKSIGSDTLRVTDITSTNAVFTVDTTMFNVPPPLDSFAVTVTFNPLLVGTETGYLIVASNDASTPLDSVVVTGEGVEAPLAVINAQFSNPVQVISDDSIDVFINLSNAGGSRLIWSASASNAPGSMAAYGKPVFGPTEGSGYADVNPDLQASSGGMYLDAMWDLQFSYNLEIVTGALGNAGAEFDGMYYYSTRWASNLLHKVDMAGNLVEEFSIAGVTGLRDLAFDGTFMYGGAAANTIYIMDFVNKTLIGTIPSPVGVRNISYDEANNGFWVGNWGDPPTLVDMSGTTLATLTTGLTGQYGAAYDSYSAGGPYLWVFDQGAGAGTPQLIHQFDLNTLSATGLTYDVTLDFPGTGGIAGGLWVGDGVVGGTASIGGVLQGTPDNFFVYELTITAPTWISLLATSGSIDPGDQYDLPLRIYGTPSTEDTAYVIVLTNDPSLPMADVMVIRDLITGIGDLETLPTTYDIAQNYPNPFNPTTTIKYQLPQVTDVKLVIYNVLGQRVRTLVNNRMEAGYHSVVWDGLNQQGSTVASGVYIYHFEAGDFQKTMKLMLLK